MSPFDRVLAAIGNATGGRPSNIEAAAEAIAALRLCALKVAAMIGEVME